MNNNPDGSSVPETHGKYTTEEIQRNRAEWKSELTSGDYPQGFGQLHTRDGKFCCLGVAAEHFAPVLGAEQYTVGQTIGYYIPGTFGRSFHYLSKEYRALLGLNFRTERILSALNDDLVPFPTIAKVIMLLPISDDPDEWD